MTKCNFIQTMSFCMYMSFGTGGFTSTYHTHNQDPFLTLLVAHVCSLKALHNSPIVILKCKSAINPVRYTYL